MNRNRTLALVLAGFLVACATAPVSQFRSSEVSTEELAVLEATFRHLFASNYSAKQEHSRTYCLTIDHMDPDSAFFSRFEDLSKQVRKGSRFESGVDLMFELSLPERIEDGVYRVSGGYYEGDLSASSTVFEVVRGEGGRWIVKKWSRGGDDEIVEVVS